jgi:hypothetical protein
MERLRKRTKTEKPQQPLDKEYDDLDCPICQKVYSREDTLLNHMECVHWEAMVCGICSKVLSSHQALLRHHMTHTDKRPFMCKLCQKTFKRVDTLQNHERSVHRDECSESEGDDIFIARQCRSCLEGNIIHHHLVWFMRYGEPRREHQCLICLKSSKFCNVITKHHEEHNLDEIPRSKAFQCRKCFRLLASQKTLNQHKCETVPKKLEQFISTDQGYPTVSYL